MKGIVFKYLGRWLVLQRTLIPCHRNLYHFSTWREAIQFALNNHDGVL